MNRHMAGAAVALLLAGVASAHAQTVARVEFGVGRSSLALTIGDLPLRVVHAPSRLSGWVAADLGPLRVWMGSTRPYYDRGVLQRQELRRLLGRDTMRMLERHARMIGARGPLQGQWYRVDRRTVMLEVSARGAPVARFFDHGHDGVFNRMELARAPRIYLR